MNELLFTQPKICTRDLKTVELKSKLTIDAQSFAWWQHLHYAMW